MSKQGFTLALRLMGLGWYIALSIILPIWGGVWLDKRLEKSPLFFLIGVLGGSVLAFYGVYRMIIPLMGNNAGKE